MTAYLYRMPAGIAGAISRPQDLTTEPATLDATNVFSAYGLPGKYSGDNFVPLASTDTASDIVGLLVRPWPTTDASDFARNVTSGGNQQGDILKRGYINVNVGGDATAITKNASVYFDLSTGSITATAPTTDTTTTDGTTTTATATVIQIPSAVFTGAGDADGNAEVAYNI